MFKQKTYKKIGRQLRIISTAVLISIIFLSTTIAHGQTDTSLHSNNLNYKFLDWYVTTFGHKHIYITKYFWIINKFDLGTDPNPPPTSSKWATYLGYTQKIIAVLDSLKIPYDTVSLNRQTEYQKGITLDSLKNCKVLPGWRSTDRVTMFRKFFHPQIPKKTIQLSFPIWSGNYVFVKSSVITNRFIFIQESIDICQLQPDNSFKLIKRIVADRKKYTSTNQQ